MTERLTPHFTLTEFVQSDTAARLGIDNTPPPAVVLELRRTAELLEQIRALLGQPIIITSGYRCRALNALLKSKPTSDHIAGRAADWICPRAGTPRTVFQALVPQVRALNIGQLVLEYPNTSTPWIHVSTRIPEKPVNRVLIIEGPTRILPVAWEGEQHG